MHPWFFCQNFIWNIFGKKVKFITNRIPVNRYRRGLETYRRAKTSKSGREYFLLFRRVRATSMTQRGVENTRVHFWTFSPISVKYQIFIGEVLGKSSLRKWRKLTWWSSKRCCDRSRRFLLCFHLCFHLYCRGHDRHLKSDYNIFI